jgi:hypothetical protein
MKVFGHEKPGLVVKASAAKLELLITLLENKVLEAPERAIRLAGAEIYAAFHNFSTGHIQQAVDEAKKTEQANATLSAFEGTKEAHDAVLAAAKAKADAASAALKKTITTKPAAVPTPKTADLATN